MKLVCDLETTTDPNDVRVWGWGAYDIEKDKSVTGSSIDDFFRKIVLRLPDKSIIYFHNLKFDGEFLFYYLFENGFRWTDDKELVHKEFKTLITRERAFYSLTIKWKAKTIVFYDSLKIIPFSVKQISKSFGIEQKKGI